MANLALLFYYYRQQMGPLGLKALLFDTAKILLAATLMGVALYVLLQYWNLTYAPFWSRMGFVLAMIAIGAVVYGLLAWALRVQGLQPLWGALRRRLWR